MSILTFVFQTVLLVVLKTALWGLVLVCALFGTVGVTAWVFERLGVLWVLTFFLQILAWPFVRGALAKYGDLNIKGSENIKGVKGAVIFAANHISELDPFLIPASLNPRSQFFPMFFVSRERAFYEKRGLSQYAYAGLAFRIFGGYPAIVGIKDFESKLKNHIGILFRGRSVCIFPEGEITPRKGFIKREHPGVAYLLWKTGRPIVPVAVCGHGGMSKNDFFAGKRKIGVFFGEPITREEVFGAEFATEPPDHDKLVEVAQVVMTRIRELIAVHGSQE